MTATRRPATGAPAPDYRHLLGMTDERGTFEHARYAAPRPEHGYCTDDMARVLVVAARAPDPDPALRGLADLALRFLGRAQHVAGTYRNRMDGRGRFTDRPTVDDCWGRAIWGLGTVAARSGADHVRQAATAQFERAALLRSPSPRATAFAVLGAVELLGAQPGHRIARRLLTDAAGTTARPAPDATWPWPEPRLAYANAVLPEALLAIGGALGRADLVDRGLGLLGWLLDRETVDGHLSVTPTGGAGPGDRAPAFDQQPIEVAAMADACARAAGLDDDPRWTDGVAAAVAWFLGDNDGRHPMLDAATGGGFDGLGPDGPNQNQGTESTLALLSTLQHARRRAAVPA